MDINSSIPMCGITKAEVDSIFKDVYKGRLDILKKTKLRHSNLHWCNLYYKKNGDTILHIAAKLGYVVLLEYLLTNFTPKAVNCKNNDDKTALHEAAQFAQYEACQILLEHDADVSALKRADWTPLMLACIKVTPERSFKTVKLLLDNGSLVNYRNKDGWSALHLISREGDENILNLLISQGMNVKIKTKNGRTALHIAALHGHMNIVSLLLNLGVYVNETDNCGNTPLQEAILGGNIAICRFLIANNADVNCTNTCNYNLLHLAASTGNIDVLDFVVNELKIDVNSKVNEQGYTALHCAARKCKTKAYNYLILCGGDINIKDSFDRLAVDYF